MIVIKGRTISEVYEILLHKLINEGDEVENTFELLNTVLEIEEPSIKDIYLPMRNFSKKYLMKELNWYWTGNNDVNYIGEVAKMWYDISDDGKTSNSAYGYIIHKKYERDQLMEIYELLKKDSYSRRAILNISDALLHKQNTKDYQCTIALQFLIRDNKLNMTVFMRSNDIYFGLPYDSIYFMTIQDWLAKKLNVKIGSYTHHATSMHMYKSDVDKFKEHNNVINLDKYETIYDII